MGLLHFWPALCLISAPFFGQVRANKEDGVDDAQFHTFVTRPDIKAPRWDIKTPHKDLIAPGYWFVSPYESITQTTPGGPWIGPHIYDHLGGLIWSGVALFNHMQVHDFRVSKVHGKDMITIIDPLEVLGYVIDHHYKIYKPDTVDMGELLTSFNMHELNFVDNGTRVMILDKDIRRATLKMSQDINFDGRCETKFDGFKELDAQNQKVLFNWTSYDRVALNESTFQTVGDKCDNHWDYIHGNSVDKCPDGNYLFSGRHTDTIYKVSHKDGHIMWRLGGVKSDVHMGSLNFSRQHDVRCHSQNATHTVVSFLNNAKGEQAFREPTSNFSRGLMIAVQEKQEPKTASLVAHYDHPDGPGGYAFRRGSMQVLDNGNVYMCWSEKGLFSEHTPDGTLVLQARFEPPSVGTYRGYKFPFVGLPLDPPDVVTQTLELNDNKAFDTRIRTRILVSWNGATEVANWIFYKTLPDGNLAQAMLLANKPRVSFETAYEYVGYAAYVVVEAIDKDGNSLGKSGVIATRSPKDMASADVAKEVDWLQQTHAAHEAPAVKPKPTQETNATDTVNHADKGDNDTDHDKTVPAEEDAAVDIPDNSKGSTDDDDEVSDSVATFVNPGVMFVFACASTIIFSVIIWFAWRWRKARNVYEPLNEHKSMEDLEEQPAIHKRSSVYSIDEGSGSSFTQAPPR